MKRFWILASLLAACQPQAHRLLLVDFASSDPIVLEATAAPWHEAGYHVEYRRFYPHLTRHDLSRYRAVLLLGGREPEGLSNALTIGDLAILSEWVRGDREGVVILGSASGTLDRWVMNRWLAAEGAGISIGTQALGAPAVPLPASALDNAGFAPFAAGSSRALVVRNRTQTLARASGTAVVAASRVKDGLIVVTGRELLGSSGRDARTREFLVALARLTRRPAEWASVAPGKRSAPLTLAGAPQRVTMHPPQLAPPPGASVTVMPRPVQPAEADDRPVLPNWVSRQGLRVLWSRFAPGAAALNVQLRFVDVAALNGLASAITPAALGDTIYGGRYNVWRVTVEHLQATSVRWFPAMRFVDIASQGADEVDRHGELVTVPCGLDSLFWRGALRATYRAMTRLGGARPELLVGIALDLDSAREAYDASGFCDSDYREGLASFGLEQAEHDRLAALPPTARYDTLLERGLLERYYARLESSVAERAGALRAELRRLSPDLKFAFRTSEAPIDWFSLGLLRGMSAREAPAMLWWRERDPRALLRRYRERGIVAISALDLDPEHVVANEWGRLKPLVFGANSGFWVQRASDDSVARLIRRFTK